MLPMAKSDAERSLELAIRLENLAAIVVNLQEGMEGTNRTRGMKEKITLAEYNIELNKQAFREMQEQLHKTEERLGLSMAQAMARVETKIDEKFSKLETSDNEQKTFIQKMTPWVNGIAWFMTLGGGIVITLLLTGKLHLVP